MESQPHKPYSYKPLPKNLKSFDFISHFQRDSPQKIYSYNMCTSYAHKYASKLTKLICLHNFADNIKHGINICMQNILNSTAQEQATLSEAKNINKLMTSTITVYRDEQKTTYKLLCIVCTQIQNITKPFITNPPVYVCLSSTFTMLTSKTVVSTEYHTPTYALIVQHILV